MSSRSRPQSRNLFPHQEQVSNWTVKLSFGLSIKIWILALAHRTPACVSIASRDVKLRHQPVDSESRHEIETSTSRYRV
jgi:hypothetical protein